jgi:hypothetical protein
MRLFITTVLVFVGMLHLLPLAGVAGAARLRRLYGVELHEQQLELLLRHRAVLFGLLGSFMLWAAVDPALQRPALWAGLVSVASFLWLARRAAPLDAPLARVARVDGLALPLLLAALVVQALR